ncbi:unnamed protein product [Toxocara canis]|uniref:UBA domain-containing protein n=1 Tax=Toxocara canis TaxID=6265 RepID=A0A183UC78_TOXCA|nr:unnamed protein product [Toxocara canis]
MSCKQLSQGPEPPDPPSKLIFPVFQPQSAPIESNIAVSQPKASTERTIVMLLPIRRCVYCPCVRSNCPLVPLSRCACQTSTTTPLLPCPIVQNQLPDQHYMISSHVGGGIRGDPVAIHKPSIMPFTISSLPQLKKALNTYGFITAAGLQGNQLSGFAPAFATQSNDDYEPGIDEVLEMGQPIAIEIAENDTATLQELISLGFVEASKMSDAGACGTPPNLESRSGLVPGLPHLALAHTPQIPAASFSIDIDTVMHHLSLNRFIPRVPQASDLQYQQPVMSNALPGWSPGQFSSPGQFTKGNLPLLWSQYQSKPISFPFQQNLPGIWPQGQPNQFIQSNSPPNLISHDPSQLSQPWPQNQLNQPSLKWQPAPNHQQQTHDNSALSNQRSMSTQQSESIYRGSASPEYGYGIHSNHGNQHYRISHTSTLVYLMVGAVAKSLLQMSTDHLV